MDQQTKILCLVITIVSLCVWGYFKQETETEPKDVFGELSGIYESKLRPLEEHYNFYSFHSPKLEKEEFYAKPMILLVGQYSTGKTTFARYLIGRDFPAMRIGPEPTTDGFVTIMYDDTEEKMPGNALVADSTKPFRSLEMFGTAFLNKLQCSTTPSPVLQKISIVDTPGILSGEKERVYRGYDFAGVLEWFAERVDRIILLFDANKLDISDDFRRSIEALRGHDDKIRIVLNKADMMDHKELMRVFGAIKWSLGKVLQTPEVAHVYIGSFWDKPLHKDAANHQLFEDDEKELLRDLESLPQKAALRKVNDLIKRARLAKAHAYVIAELYENMPSCWFFWYSKEHKKQELINNLYQVYDRIQKVHKIAPGNFPDIKKMQEMLANYDFHTFNSLNIKLMKKLDQMLTTDIPKLMVRIQQENTMKSKPLFKDLKTKKRPSHSSKTDEL